MAVQLHHLMPATRDIAALIEFRLRTHNLSPSPLTHDAPIQHKRRAIQIWDTNDDGVAEQVVQQVLAVHVGEVHFHRGELELVKVPIRR